ncbi:3388_t:CDS:2 [Entrophospora sp. SA101]|nr:3388_t:CDS:2 [Entrophospora sp. SA101]
MEHYKSGEVASAPIDDLPTFRAELKSLIAQYDLNDVYNADETALYWKLEPSKSLSSGPITVFGSPIINFSLDNEMILVVEMIGWSKII